MKTAAILLNGPCLDSEIVETDVIAADGGLKLLKNRKPVACVGDFDSLENKPEGINYVVFPKEKDETDGQLAVSYAKQAGYDQVNIYAATGGDLRHVLGNVGLLKYARDIKIGARITAADFTIRLVEGKVSESARPGQKISLFPFFGDATVKSSKGLYYPLSDLTLSAGTSRGLSNVATATEISFEVSSGMLLLITYNK